MNTHYDGVPRCSSVDSVCAGALSVLPGVGAALQWYSLFLIWSFGCRISLFFLDKLNAKFHLSAENFKCTH